MATGIIQTPSMMSDCGTLRDNSSPRVIHVPSSSDHLLFVIASGDVYSGVYFVHCISNGTVGVSPIKAFTTTTMTITGGTNTCTVTSTSTTSVSLVTMTIRGEKAYR